MKSIISNERRCLVCGAINDLHKHHIFGGANRKHSDADGLWVYLCANHHNMSDAGVHFNKDMDMALKKLGQQAYEKLYDHESFMEKYRRNWL